MNIALILSGGSGSRFGGDIPKQYLLLAGKELISYSIDAVRQSRFCDTIIISADKEHVETLKEGYGTEVVIGGETRNQSLRNGLEYIKRNYPKCEKVFINEAARPFVTEEIIEDYFNKLEAYDAVITAQHITDSLGCYGEMVTERSDYYLIQAPEAFRFDLLYKHFDAYSPITATVQQLPPKSKVYRNFNFQNNMKITYTRDLNIAEYLMRCLY